MRSGIRKSAAAVLVLAVLCGVFTGCHGSVGAEAFAVPEEFDTQRQYTVTFWAKNDTNRTQVAIYRKAIADFQECYPNITVNLRLYTDYGKIYNDVISNIATNTTPNVCITYPDHIATYLTGMNTVVPLEDLFRNGKYGLGGSEVRFDSPYTEELVPEFLNECRIGEHTYAIPFMRSTEALYINRTYVEKLGYEVTDILTWDFVWEVADAATEKDSGGSYKVNGQKVMIPFIYKSTDNMMIQILKQRGAGYSDPEGGIEIFNDTTKEILKTVGEHAAKGAFSTFKISSYPGNFLNAGQCIFAIDSTAGATWMGSNAPLMDISADKVVPFDTEVRMIPQFDPDNPKMISQGPSICIFNKKDPQEVLASWLFAQFLLTDGVQTAYAETEGYVPVTLRAQNSDAYQDYLSREGEDNNTYYNVKIRASKLLMENTSNTFVTPVFNGSTSLRDAAGQMIENVTKSVRRKETIDDAYLEKLFSDVTALYRLNQLSAANTSGRKDLGPLPKTSVALLTALCAAWVLIGAYVVISKLKEKQHKK